MTEVSVVIPAYNAAPYLGQAIESALGQTFDDLEVIVVDDGSTDDTAQVVHGFGRRVRYAHQPNSGVSVARNKGVEQSMGRYVAFLDADDIWAPQKLAKQIEAFRVAPGHGLCYSAFLVADSELNAVGIHRREPSSTLLNALLCDGNVVGSPSTVICRRELCEDAGGFDPRLSQCADWDMWIRLASLTEFIRLDEPLVTYRQHETSMSMDPDLLERDSVRVLQKGFSMPGLEPGLGAKRHKAEARNYMVLAGTYFQAGRYRDFARCAARSVSMDPRRLGYLASFPVRKARRRPSGAEVQGWG